MKFVRKLVRLQAERNFIIRARVIPGFLNLICDSICRFQIDKFRRLAPHTAGQVSSVYRPNAIFKDKVNDLWDNAISSNTRMAYRTGLQCLLTFLMMSGVIFRPPVLPSISEEMLIYFITYCHSCSKLNSPSYSDVP